MNDLNKLEKDLELENHRISAIKEHRDRVGCTLLEAKDAVVAFRKTHEKKKERDHLSKMNAELNKAFFGTPE